MVLNLAHHRAIGKNDAPQIGLGRYHCWQGVNDAVELIKPHLLGKREHCQHCMNLTIFGSTRGGFLYRTRSCSLGAVALTEVRPFATS